MLDIALAQKRVIQTKIGNAKAYAKVDDLEDKYKEEDLNSNGEFWKEFLEDPEFDAWVQRHFSLSNVVERVLVEKE